ncbi:MAG: zf-TFIIB domain-containing protein [bacterium]|nr:zf-TFIIB domain-containing protein [bacterium]
MKCPACRVPMYVAEYQQIELDLCGRCDGVWFDGGELALLLGDELPLDGTGTAPDEATRSCPLCDKPMAKVNIGPGRRVVVDQCPQQCGLWFDGPELAELTTDLETAGWGLSAKVRGFLREMFPAKGGK